MLPDDDIRHRILQQQEGALSRQVLHNIAAKQPLHEFRETVMALFTIVEDKLYKVRFHSLEQYFRTLWGISRAQVYRFYNCARILKVSLNCLDPVSI
jgi:hypothetical protein